MYSYAELSAFVAAYPIALLLAFGLFAYNIFDYFRKKCDLPGPIGLPVVGYIPFLGPRPHKLFAEMSREYGPIFQVKIGRRTAVILNTVELSHEAFTFMGSELDAHLGAPFNPGHLILTTVSTVVGSVLFGFQFDNSNPVIAKQFGTIKAITDFFDLGGLVDNLPFAEHILRNRVAEFKETTEPVNEVTAKYMKSHQYCGEAEHVRDVADALVKVSETMAPEELASIGLNKYKIRHLASDLLQAGFATTTDSLSHFVNVVAHYQYVQKRCQLEIDEQLAGEIVKLSDKNKLPYVNATISEIFRLIPLVHMGLAHSAMEDGTFRGYCIPKNTIIYQNIFAMQRDERLYEDPEVLNPGRYLLPDGSFDAEA